MTMVEGRRAERVRSFLRARIIFNNKNSSIDCTVKNISATGAKLDLCNTFAVPAEFDLAIPAKNRVLRARMTWRDAEAIGIEFLDEGLSINDAGETELEILERENRRLRVKVAALTKRLGELGQDVPE